MMNKLTAKKCLERIDKLKTSQRRFGISIFEEEYLEALEIALPVLEHHSNSCSWAYDENDHYWSSSCGEGWSFNDGGPVENKVKFCQGCGRSVVLEQQEGERGEEA